MPYPGVLFGSSVLVMNNCQVALFHGSGFEILQLIVLQYICEIINAEVLIKNKRGD